MDMTDRGLAHPKAEPQVVTKTRRAKTDRHAERICRGIVKRRDKSRCVVPGCAAFGRHMHHIVYRSKSKALRWATANNCLLCVSHHRLEHAGTITISGDADVEIVVSGDIDRLKFRL